MLATGPVWKWRTTASRASIAGRIRRHSVSLNVILAPGMARSEVAARERRRTLAGGELWLPPARGTRDGNVLVYAKSYRFAQVVKRIGARQVTPATCRAEEAVDVLDGHHGRPASARKRGEGQTRCQAALTAFCSASRRRSDCPRFDQTSASGSLEKSNPSPATSIFADPLAEKSSDDLT